MSTVMKSETFYIINTTSDAHVIGDLGLAWAGYGETYEDYVRAVSEEAVQGSMGLQRLLATGAFKKISHEEMLKEVQGQGVARTEANSTALGDPEFMEQATDITPGHYAGGEELPSDTGRTIEVDPSISQRVDAGLDEDLPATA